MKSVMQRKQVLRELMLDGVISIMEKTSPRALQAKLAVYQCERAQAAKVKLVAG
jgi:hypothetical protein